MKAKTNLIAVLAITLALAGCKEKARATTSQTQTATALAQTMKQTQTADASAQKAPARIYDDWGIIKNYEEAENCFDKKNYADAIEKYAEVVEYTDCFYEWEDDKKKQFSSEFDFQFDETGEVKLLYYSLYNIACCHSLMGNFSEAKRYLLDAIYAGYPNLNYILNDSDMRPFFSSDSSLKSEVGEIFNLGNSKALVQGKKLKEWIVNDCDEYGFDGDTVILYYTTSDWKDHKYKGTYEVKNYHILMHFDKESYRKPDPWASEIPGGGTITAYTSYSEYPEYEDVDFGKTINWFSSCRNYSLKIIEDEYKSDWTDKDYSELIAARIKEYYSIDRKIKRTEDEIKASAQRRRQKVLDYIEKVGKDDSTVYVLPEGTKKVEYGDLEIPDETVAVLLPEGLEVFKTCLPSSVKYINFPSTLKRLGDVFPPDSEIEEIELPENLEEVYSVLFWYSPDKTREVYVPGWAETPPEWHKQWDRFCNAHFGSYLE